MFMGYSGLFPAVLKNQTQGYVGGREQVYVLGLVSMEKEKKLADYLAV